MDFLKRTHHCGDLRGNLNNQTVILNGWVHRLRDHGPFVFVNLRDRSGLVQCVVQEDTSKDLFTQVRKLRSEYCIAIKGVVALRPAEMRNTEMATGDVEVHITQCWQQGKRRTAPEAPLSRFALGHHAEQYPPTA